VSAVPSDTVKFVGALVIDGAQYRIVLTVDTVGLIHVMGAKAARSKGKKSADAGGLVTCHAVRE
jgi:hypothetical protein